jgi:hypothetical protein
MVARRAARMNALRTGGPPPQRPKPVPAPQISTSPRSAEIFTLFTKLPVKLRHQIWHFAAQRRPRVIQLYYDTIVQEWRASKDGRGGLPSIIGIF